MTERKNPHTPEFGVKEFACLSVRVKLQPQLSQDWQNRMGKKKLGHLWQQPISQDFFIVRKVAGRARAKGQNSKILTQYLSCLTWD